MRSVEAAALRHSICDVDHGHTHEPVSPRYDGRQGNKLGLSWEQAAQNLRDDIGARPSPLYSLDHIVHGKGTVELNLRWANHRRQNTNQLHNQVSREEFERVVYRLQELENENKALRKKIANHFAQCQALH